MKVFAIVGSIIVVIVIALAGIGFSRASSNNADDFMRLHIRANSNSDADQNIKYVIKQSVVDELTPIFCDVTTKADAMQRLADNLDLIENIADTVLSENGFSYTARAAISSEYFPTREYTNSDADIVLPEGTYDALILDLGQGAGDNWWCVVYPPICFLENDIGGSAGVHFRSKLLEWLHLAS